MPQTDLADLIASLPPLTFAPASEAPVAPDRLCLVAPDDEDWTLAYRNEDGWFSADGMRLEPEPLLYLALPPAPGRCSPSMICNLAQFISNLLKDGEYARAATMIDELADRVRGLRDSPLSRLVDKPGS